jgi:hypothetical protein
LEVQSPDMLQHLAALVLPPQAQQTVHPNFNYGGMAPLPLPAGGGRVEDDVPHLEEPDISFDNQ